MLDTTRCRSSLPLDRPGRLAGEVVDDAVDALDLVDDAGGDAAKEGRLEGVEVGGHAVDGGDGAERADVLVGAQVAHDAHGLDREEDGEGLPDGVVEARGADLLEVDTVGLLQGGDAVRRDGAGHADGEAGAGEG